MTLLSPSLLVLAWDDADTNAAPVLAGQPAPPTLPLVRALAAHQPTLAVLPQLPEALRHENEFPLPPAPPAASSQNTAAAPPLAELELTTEPPASMLDSATGQPAAAGLSEPAELAPAPLEDATPLSASGAAATSLRGSRLVGLSDWPAPLALVAAEPAPVVADDTAFAPTRIAAVADDLTGFSWPPFRPSGSWQAPAAPYAGSSLPGAVETQGPENPLITASPAALARVAASPTAPSPETASAPVPSAPGSPAPIEALAKGAIPALPAGVAAIDFDSYSASIGPAEAADLSAPEDDLTLDPTAANPAPTPAPTLPEAPERASLTQALAALHRPATVETPEALTAPPPAPAATMPARLSDNLHYRIIQYARFATHLATRQEDEFEVIYAPNWPVWLAAIEISNRLRRPLVLHLAALAISTAAPADRGWLLELERYALRRAHTVLVATEALRQQVLHAYNLPENRVEVVAPGDEEGIRAVLAAVRPAVRRAVIGSF